MLEIRPLAPCARALGAACRWHSPSWLCAVPWLSVVQGSAIAMAVRLTETSPAFLPAKIQPVRARTAKHLESYPCKQDYVLHKSYGGGVVYAQAVALQPD